MRIASLLPSATEIAFALGCGPQVVAVSHECDFPAAAAALPVLTRSAVPTTGRSPAQIDHDISRHLARGGSTYQIDLPLLRRLAPDLILTQALCDVCAVSEGPVRRAVHEQQLGSRVLTLTPLDLEGVFASIEHVGRALGRAAPARALTDDLRGQVRALRDRPSAGPRPRVLALEWTPPPPPPFIGGHWVPGQIAAAGGHDALGLPGRPSFRTTWEAIAAARPDVVIVLPCGFTLDQIVAQAADLEAQSAWRDLPAVRVWAVEASAWFSRPGPRLVQGIDVLARILADPDAPAGPPGARRLAAPPRASRLPAVPA